MKTSISDGTSDRVIDAILLYAEQEAQTYIGNPLEGRHQLKEIELKLQYYDGVYSTFRTKPNTDEKFSLRFVRHEMAKMKARLNPTLLNQILYSRFGNSVRNFINGNNLLYAKLNRRIKDLQKDLIAEHNLQSLSGSMKKIGFKIEIEGALERMIAQNLPKFHIRYFDIHYPKTDFVLHFNKIPQTDLYYFEKFEAISRPTLEALLKNDPSCNRYSFSLLDKIQFKAGEAANLVNGKCVCKSTEGKETWLLLDATNQNKHQPFKNISFNLEKALEQLPIKQNSSQYQALLQTLKAGNAKEVVFTINDQSVKYTIEAAPLRKTIDLLNKDNQLMELSKVLKGRSTELTHKLNEKINGQDHDTIDLDQPRKYTSKIR